MNVFKKIRAFFAETFGELKKTDWPTSKELRRSAAVIIAGTMFLGAYIAVADFFLYQVVDLLIDVVIC
ncbi:MAG: preprotein translocase subunit SecE [Puniceicoccales bacterium]|jgi:preprotein translocase subunit SecE|nr:preprotein translocase subunit SecE [Puniceicoccales bacterium]